MNLEEIIQTSEKELREAFKQTEEICLFNSEKILNAFQKNKVSNIHFNSATGYGYGDLGRDIIEKVYADVFKTESALVRAQFVSGTHALSTSFFGVLRPGDTMLSITGMPYDTLHQVIGLVDNDSSLKAFGINFEEINLINNDFNYEKLKEILNNQEIKVIHIQRSIGYESRNTLSIQQLDKVINFIKNINSNIIILVDNCYCELCSKIEPSEVGADLVIGSLIKNLGGGIASGGGYIVGKKDLVELCAQRLTSPGLGSEVGSSMGMNKLFLQGLYFSPLVVSNALKIKALTAKLFEKLNIKTINNNLNDIVLGIVFNDETKLKTYVKAIQNNSAIDSNSDAVATDMPGYEHKIIMASGSFTDGSSIELSCDAPIKEPYIAFQQGSLTYEYGKISIKRAIEKIIN